MVGEKKNELARRVVGMFPFDVRRSAGAWADGATSLNNVSINLDGAAPKMLAAFGDSEIGEQAKAAFERAAKRVKERSEQLQGAADELDLVADAIEAARKVATANAEVPEPGEKPQLPSGIGDDRDGITALKIHHAKVTSYNKRVEAYGQSDEDAEKAITQLLTTYAKASTVLAAIHADPTGPTPQPLDTSPGVPRMPGGPGGHRPPRPDGISPLPPGGDGGPDVLGDGDQDDGPLGGPPDGPRDDAPDGGWGEHNPPSPPGSPSSPSLPGPDGSPSGGFGGNPAVPAALGGAGLFAGPGLAKAFKGALGGRGLPANPGTIGSTTRAGGPGALGRSGAATPGAPVSRAGGGRGGAPGVGRGGAGGGRGAVPGSAAGRGRSGGAAGGRGAGGGRGGPGNPGNPGNKGSKGAGGRGAIPGATGARGRKDRDQQGRESNPFDDGQDWLDDDGQAPAVLD